MILGTQEKGVTRMKCVLLIGNNVLIIHRGYYSYGFLRELDLAFGKSPDRDESHPFHGQTRSAKLNDFVPDVHEAMELWALGPHVILAKVISVAGCTSSFTNA